MDRWNVGAAALAVAMATSAATGSEADDELEQIVVTGSRIQRADLEKTIPITVLDAQQMETRNAVLPAELLTSLPSVVNLPQNETRLGSSGARGDNANLNMRNLGATATLILQDGRRMAINPMTAGLSQAVNVNQLPTRGIDHIEVLRDGASSIYGSDAVGGVINYVLKRRMDGVEASVRYDQPAQGAGEMLQAGLAFGSTFAEGRGRLFGTLAGLTRNEVRLTDRNFSNSSLNVDRAPAGFNALAGPFDQRFTRGYYPTFRLGSTGTSGATWYLLPANGTPTLSTTNPTTAANRALYPDFMLDINQFGFASPKVRRGDVFLSAEFDITDSLTIFGDASYYAAESTMQRQPLAVNGPTTDQAMVMPVDSPFNPFGSRYFSPTGAPNADGSLRRAGTPQAIALTQFMIAGLAPESVKTNSDAMRLVAGLRGAIADTSWKWESSLFYNEVNGEDNASPDVRESLLAAAIAGSGGTYFNPFGYTFRVANNAVVVDQPYTNPQALVDSFSDTYRRTARSYLASADARASGRLITLGSMDIQAAIGVEHRREDLRDLRPPFHGENPASSGLPTTNNDFILHPARPDVRGERDVTSAYAEVVVPVVTEERSLPFVNSFEISASGRFEHYSDFGNTTKPKIGANWRPVSWLMLRGSYNEGFMAPSLAALYTSTRWSISTNGTADPYLNAAIGQGNYTMRNYFGGNPDLKPQESKGTTFGFVLDVPGVQGLSITADYWKIERTNLLGQRGVADILANDAALLRAYTAAQVAAGVAPNNIDVGAGTSGYRGDPAVVRLAPTPEQLAAFATWNAANPGSPAAPTGLVWSTDTPFLNLSSATNKGVDVGVRYLLPRFSWGRIGLNTDASWLWRAKTVVPTTAGSVVSNDLYGGGAARWRTTSNITWENGPWNAGLGIYHVGKTLDTPTVSRAVYQNLGSPSYIKPFFTNGNTVYRLVIDPVVSFNFSLGYQLDAKSGLGDTRLRLGIANLSDRKPPLSASGDGFGYDPSTSQNLLNGRTFSFEVTSRF
ncbi:MAG: TonB-dependent receptor [Gammaproteobacteria bacterium]|nr:TonB-dependent receptor [Gammaproteobacteria bacterium]